MSFFIDHFKPRKMVWENYLKYERMGYETQIDIGLNTSRE
jgi:hypothetical protein